MFILSAFVSFLVLSNKNLITLIILMDFQWISEATPECIKEKYVIKSLDFEKALFRVLENWGREGWFKNP